MENLITIKSINAVRSLVKGKDMYAFCSEPLDSVKARGIYEPFSYLELHLASTDEKFYACKNIHESILANMEEEINQKHFLVRVKANGVFDLPSLLDKEVKLRGYVRVNEKDCRQIVAVGNKIIGEYAIPFIDKKDFSSIKEQKDMVDKVKAPFEGDYICERAETFITYHDGIKDPQIFLVLKSK